MKIGIWHWSTKPFDGHTVRCEPSGGTETAIAYTAEALASKGNDVVVFSNTSNEGEYEGVDYRNANGFAAIAHDLEFDAFGIVRHLAACSVPIRTKHLFYWAHDNPSQPFMHGAVRFHAKSAKGQEMTVNCLSLGELQFRFDTVFCVSEWQASAIRNVFVVDPDRLCQVGNALQPALFQPKAVSEEKEPVILYSLPPDRGMVPLLEIFVDVKKRVPKAELHLYSSSQIYGNSPEEDNRDFGKVYGLARRIPGVRLMGSVPQPVLAKAMQKAMVFAYPTEVEETFCISLLEAQASGLVCVASPKGAIPERIDNGTDGFLIDGSPFDRKVQKRFEDVIVKVLQDNDKRTRIAESAQQKAFGSEYQYESVASRVLERIEVAVSKPFLHDRALNVDSLPDPYLSNSATAEGVGKTKVPLATLRQYLEATQKLLHLSRPDRVGGRR